MKICVAQTKPVKGNIQDNIDQHKKLIELAVSNGADTIIFPELSITGYEPGLAKELAIDIDDDSLNDFQKISDSKQLAIAVGMPVKADAGVLIGMLIFQPHQPRQIYSKRHLHSDEYPYFVRGNNLPGLTQSDNKIAMAICYEISVPEHSANAYKNGAEIYIASVAKSVNGVDKALETLSAIAASYSMTVLMSNCTGYCDNFECGGKTSAWNNKGVLEGQLNNSDVGILIFDTGTQELIKKVI